MDDHHGVRRLLDDLHLGLKKSLPLSFIFWPLLCYKEAYSYARFLKPVPRGRLLHIGCGDGAFLLKYRRMGFQCWGLERAANYSSITQDMPVFTCRMEELEGYDHSFDVITLNHVFEHLHDPQAALLKLRRLLAPGGRILIRMPTSSTFLFHRFSRI